MRYQLIVLANLFLFFSCGKSTRPNSPVDFETALVGTWNPISSTLSQGKFGYGPLELTSTQTNQDGYIIIDGQLVFGADHSFSMKRIAEDEAGCLWINEVGGTSSAWFFNAFDELVLEVRSDQILIPTYSIKNDILTLTYELGGVETYEKVVDLPPHSHSFPCETDHIYFATIHEVNRLLTTALADALKKAAQGPGTYTGAQHGSVEITRLETESMFSLVFEGYSDDAAISLDGQLQVEWAGAGDRKYQGTLSLSGRYRGRLDIDLSIEQGVLSGSYGYENGNTQSMGQISGYIDGYPAPE